jgi:hypothetical protein
MAWRLPWVDGIRFAPPAGQHNRPLHALPWVLGGSRVDCWACCRQALVGCWAQGSSSYPRRASRPIRPCTQGHGSGSCTLRFTCLKRRHADAVPCLPQGLITKLCLVVFVQQSRALPPEPVAQDPDRIHLRTSRCWIARAHLSVLDCESAPLGTGLRERTSRCDDGRPSACHGCAVACIGQPPPPVAPERVMGGRAEPFSRGCGGGVAGSCWEVGAMPQLSSRGCAVGLAFRAESFRLAYRLSGGLTHGPTWRRSLAPQRLRRSHSVPVLLE